MNILAWKANEYGKIEGNKLISTSTENDVSAVFTSTLPISRFNPSTSGIHFNSLSVGKEIAIGVGPWEAQSITYLWFVNTHMGTVRFQGVDQVDIVQEVESENQKMQLLVNQNTGEFEYIIDGKSNKFTCFDLIENTLESSLYYKVIFIDAAEIEASERASFTKYQPTRNLEAHREQLPLKDKQLKKAKNNILDGCVFH